MRRLLLYKTGETDPRLTPQIGDYERWFGRILSCTATLEIHRAFDAPLHRLSGYDGLIITGSPRSLVNPEPWMVDAAAFIRSTADAGVPVLGVCFGHQLIGYAFGGRVRKNPKGWEAGTSSVQLTDDGANDPLFIGLPQTLSVNQSHQDEVEDLSGQMRRLATGAHTSNQSIAVGDHVRGVQFHPEMNAHVVRRILEHRRTILRDDATACGRSLCVDSLIAGASDTPEAERVLTNFVDQFVHAA